MFKVEESAIAEVSDRVLLLMAQFGLVLFVIWLIATMMGKGHMAQPANRPRLTLTPHSASKWNAAMETNPQPYDQQAWQTAVGMAVSA